MAEKSIEEKTRKLASQRPEAGREFEQMQAAQNQLLEIQAAQKQNLMERRVMANSQAEQNQILAQAANVGAQSVAGNMQLNQATQQTMGRYGLSQPRTSSQTKQRSSEVVTRQNVTIHNNTTNITNNTVPANIGGPVQGRPIQFQQPAAQADGGMGKFKNWLNQTFARQEDAAKRRDREYQRRETALTKSSNRMMRKIEEFSKDITKKLDPRNVGRTVGGQLRTILGVLGLGLIAKNFNKILDWIFGAQKKVENEYIPKIKNFFAWIKGDENAQKPGLITKITGAFNDMFGNLFFGKDFEKYREKGLLKGIKEFLWNNVQNEEDRGVLNKVFDSISETIRKRNEKALSVIEPGSWADLAKPGQAVKKLLENLVNYFSVLIGGDKALAKLQTEHVVGKTAAAHSNDHGEGKGTLGNTVYKAPETRTTKASPASGKKDRLSVGGDSTSIDGVYNLTKTYKKKGKWVDIAETQDYMLSEDLVGENGKLIGSIGSTIGAARQIVSDFTFGASKGNINNARVANNFKELSRIAEESELKSVIVPLSFIQNTRTGNLLEDQDILREVQEGHIIGLQRAGIRLFEVDRPKTDKELTKGPKGGEFKKFIKEQNLGTLRDDSTLIANRLAPYITQDGYILGPNGQLAPISNPSNSDTGGEAVKIQRFFNSIVGVPIYKRMILWPEALKPGDIIIRELSQDEMNKLICVDERGLKAIYYKGYLSEAQRKKITMDQIDFKTVTKSSVEIIDEALTEIAKAHGNKKLKKDMSPEALVDPKNIKKDKNETAATGGTGITSSAGGTTTTSAQGDVVISGNQSSNGVSFTPASTSTADPNAGSTSTGASNNSTNKNVPTIKYTEQKASGGTGPATKGCGGNSALIDAFIPVPYHSGTRKGKVTKITIHHMAGISSIENCAKGWLSPERKSKGSSNYGIGSDGRIGLFVIEDYRAWTSSSPENDNVAVTIEVSNNKIGDGKSEKGWTIDMNVVYPKLIRLCADICWRRGISNLHYTGDKTGSLTVHRMFAATACPGEHLMQLIKSGQLEKDVNNLLNDPNFQASVQKGQEFSQPASTNAASGAAVLDASYGGGSSDPDGGELIKGTFGDFLNGAMDTIKGAIGGLSHKIADGAAWAADKVGGALDFEAGTTGGVSGVNRTATDRYIAAKYMNSKYSGYDNSYAIPSSIQAGTKLDRNEWWADFFDKEGNLKIKESDVSPQILNQLHEIQGELKKGNDLDELHLKIAADGLDAEAYHSATENQNQRRLISALLVSNSNEARAQSMTGDNI